MKSGRWVSRSKPLGCSPSNPLGKPRRFESCSPHQCAPDADGDASGLQTHDWLFESAPECQRACGGIAYTPVLETGVFGHESSSLSRPTKLSYVMRPWRNGLRGSLKNCGLRASGFESQGAHHAPECKVEERRDCNSRVSGFDGHPALQCGDVSRVTA